MIESPTNPPLPNTASLQLGAVALIGYAAGRTKKGRLALRLATMFAGPRSGLDCSGCARLLTAVATPPMRSSCFVSVPARCRRAAARQQPRPSSASSPLSAALEKRTTALAGGVKDATGKVGDTAGDVADTTVDAAAQAGTAAGEAKAKAHHRAAALSGAAGKITGLVGRRRKKGRAEGEQGVSEDAGSQDEDTSENAPGPVSTRPTPTRQAPPRPTPTRTRRPSRRLVRPPGRPRRRRTIVLRP